MDKKFTFITIGLFFWAVAAVVMHYIAPFVFDAGAVHIGFWALNFLFPVVAIPVLARVTGRTRHQMLIPIALIVLPAMTLDGLAVTFDTLGITRVYADNPELAGLTGGFLLFAFASFIFWALVWQRN